MRAWIIYMYAPIPTLLITPPAADGRVMKQLPMSIGKSNHLLSVRK